jgi:5'(3')-deoxyribonucleotidase
VIKGLKVKGRSLVVKVGTKVKTIRPVDSNHDIECKTPSIGAMKLKFVLPKKYKNYRTNFPFVQPENLAHCIPAGIIRFKFNIDCFDTLPPATLTPSIG